MLEVPLGAPGTKDKHTSRYQVFVAKDRAQARRERERAEAGAAARATEAEITKLTRLLGGCVRLAGTPTPPGRPPRAAAPAQHACAPH